MIKVKRLSILIVTILVFMTSIIVVAQTATPQFSTPSSSNVITVAETSPPKQDTPWRTHSNQNWVEAMAAEDEFVWIATHGGAVKWDTTNDSYVVYTPADGLASNVVYDLAIDTQGNKWFATIWGVSHFDGTTWTTYGLVNDISLYLNYRTFA